MADEIVIGKIGLTAKGDYVPGELYDILDMVSHEGNSYVSKIQNNEADVTNTEAWLLAAKKGEEGLSIKGDKGDTFTFNDLTTEQKEELKGDVIIYNSMTEAEKDDLASRVPITGVVEEGNTQAVSGGEVYNELTKLITATSTGEVVVKNDSVTGEIWTNVNSGFSPSGFGFIIGKHKDFNALTLKIKQRGDVNDTLITKVTVRIKKGGHQGQILATSVKDVTISVGSTLDVRFDFPNVKNVNNSDIWLEYSCNGNSGLITGDLPNQFNGRYTETLAMDDFNTSSVLLTGTLGYKPMYVLLHGNSYSVKINDDLLDSEAIENSDKPIKSAAVFDLKSELSKIVDEKYIETSSVTLGAKTNIFSTSRFSGWGQKFGKISNFDAVAYTVNAYDAEKIPTYVRLIIRKNTFDGDILYNVRQNLNLIHNTPLDVIFKLGELFINENNDDIFISYFSDGYFTLYGRTSVIPNGERVRYISALNSTITNDIVTSDSTMYSKLMIGSVETGISEEQIEKILSRVELPSESIELSLPDKIYAVVGDTLQLFYRGMIKAVNPYNYDILVSCSKGNQYPRYFEYTPVLADVGTYNFKVELKDKDGVILGSKTCQIIVRNAVQSPATETVFLNVGDSLTSTNVWGIEAHRRLTGTGGTPVGLGLSNISFRGRKTGSGIGWEGNGGWTWESYTTAGVSAFRFDVSGVVDIPALDARYTNNGQTFIVAEVNVTSGSGYIRCLSTGSPTASGVLTKTLGNGDATISFSASTADTGNPFWNNGVLDFPNYVNTYMGGQVDCIFFLLTWNGQTPHRTDFSDIINTAKILVDHIHTNYPNCKMKIMGIQLPSLNGGMGANYGATGTSHADEYGMVVTALNMNKAYQDWCNEPSYSSFLEFVNVSSQFDSENNMRESDTPVNTRSSKTEKRGTNGVHPNNDGYLQIGDVQFRNIVANYCQ